MVEMSRYRASATTSMEDSCSSTSISALLSSGLSLLQLHVLATTALSEGLRFAFLVVRTVLLLVVLIDAAA